MKILHLSTYDIIGGGAISTYRLHHGLINMGLSSKMFVYEKHSADDSVINYRWPNGQWERRKRNKREQRIKNDFQKYSTNIPEGFEPFSDIRTPNLNVVKQFPDSDIINLHWAARFIDIQDLLAKVQDKPIVWRLSDQNPITGGCHYDAGCGKFLSECGACPQLGSSIPEDLSNQIWHKKKDLYASVDPARFHFIAQSNWMAGLVKESPIFSKFKVRVIPNGLDTEIFQPRDKTFSRELFNISPNKKVILFVSDSIVNRRKGLILLLNALKQLDTKNDLVVCTIGRKKISPIPNLNYIHLGAIGDQRLLSLAYSMADVHVMPSLQDNLANTVIESLCCGTPVIGFPVGGNLDMIEHQVNGYLCEGVGESELTEGINNFLKNSDSFDRVKIRENAVRKFDYRLQAKAVADLYKEIIEDFRNSKN